jgi:Domain of unknown function (DUF5666)
MSECGADDLRVGGEPDPFPAVSQRRRRGVQVTSAAAIALGLILSGGAVVGAATPTSSSASLPSWPGQSRPDGPSTHQPMGGRPTVAGVVKEVGDGTFTIAEQDGATVTVEVDSSTTYFDPGVGSPTIATVKVGEFVAVFGSESSGSVSATRVGIGRPPGGAGGGPGGDWKGPAGNPGIGPEGQGRPRARTGSSAS